MTRQMLNIIRPDFGGICWLRVFLNNPYRMSASHSHYELELNLITAGSAAYLVDGVRYDIIPGTLIYLYPQQEHQLIAETSDFEMWIIVVSQEFLQKNFSSQYFTPLRRMLPCGPFCKHLSPVAAERLGEMCEELAAPCDNADAANAALGYFMSKAWTFFCDASAQPTTKHISSKIAAALKIISAQAEFESVERIAESLDIEQSQLSRLFKRQTGMTITQYRQKTCLERFLMIWRQKPKVNMAHAALQAGFGSYPQFHRVFRAYFKLSPFEYFRKMH